MTDRQGYSLSALFVLMTTSAALVAGFTPLVRLAVAGSIDGFQLSAALVCGFFAGGFIGLLIGLLQFRASRAAPIGAATGAVLGLMAGMMALLPTAALGSSALAMLIGSGLIVGVALINRRVNG